MFKTVYIVIDNSKIAEILNEERKTETCTEALANRWHNEASDANSDNTTFILVDVLTMEGI